MREVTIRLIFSFFFLGIMSCDNKPKNLKSTLTYGNCFWNIHNRQSANEGRIAYCYKFNKDGSCKLLFTPNKAGQRDEFNFDDNEPTEKAWQVKGDTTIYILGIERKVVSFTSDTILLVNPVSNERDTLIKNCN